MSWIALTPKQTIGSKLYIRERDIVWLHMDQSSGGGTIICHTRGTTSVNESVDQIKSRMHTCKTTVFTIDVGGNKKARVIIALEHIRMFFNVGKDVRIRLSRGEFEVLQSMEDVKRVLKEPV